MQKYFLCLESFHQILFFLNKLSVENNEKCISS